MAGKGLSAEKVVVAAASLADRRGYEKMSLAVLAGELGVRVPSLYKHIDGLDDLRKRVALLAADELFVVVSEVLQAHRGNAAFAAAARAYRAYAVQFPGRYEAFIRMPLAATDRPDDREPLAPIAAAIRGLGWSESDTTAIMLAARSALRGFAAIETSGDAGDPADADAAFDQLLAMFKHALAASDSGLALQLQFEHLPVHGR